MSKQPARQPSDGSVGIDRVGGGRLCISVTTDGVAQSIVIGEFNAWRLFGVLAAMLEIRLPPAVAKRICM